MDVISNYAARYERTRVEELSDLLTAQVEIRVKKKTRRGESGEIAIQFSSLDELNGLIERLRGPQ